MRKAFSMFFLVSLFFCTSTFTQKIIAQETQEVVTAEGVKTVDVEEQNREVKQRLNEIKEKQQKEREEKQQDKQNTKRAGRLISKILIGIVIIGGAVLWRKFKGKKDEN